MENKLYNIQSPTDVTKSTSYDKYSEKYIEKRQLSPRCDSDKAASFVAEDLCL
jgi:hypothetical protein